MSLGEKPNFNFSPGNQIFQIGRNSSKNKYHNIGQLRTPYIGKHSNFSSAQGDYGPPQNTDYYTVDNPLYPYPMMSQWEASQYIPGQGCAFGVPGQYVTHDYSNPDTGFVPPNYFSPTQIIPPKEYPYPSQTYGKKLIENMVEPVREDIMPVEEYPPYATSARNVFSSGEAAIFSSGNSTNINSPPSRNFVPQNSNIQRPLTNTPLRPTKEGFCNSCSGNNETIQQDIQFITNDDIFNPMQYEGKYVKLIDTYTRLQRNLPPYKDGEKWKI